MSLLRMYQMHLLKDGAISKTALLRSAQKKVAADFIITRNTKDFSRSSIRALTPKELFDELDARGIHYEEIDF